MAKKTVIVWQKQSLISDNLSVCYIFKAKISLQLTQSTTALTYNITRLYVPMWDYQICANATSAWSSSLLIDFHFSVCNILCLVRYVIGWISHKISVSDFSGKVYAVLLQIVILFQLTLILISQYFPLEELLIQVYKLLNLLIKSWDPDTWSINIISAGNVRWQSSLCTTFLQNLLVVFCTKFFWQFHSTYL